MLFSFRDKVLFNCGHCALLHRQNFGLDQAFAATSRFAAPKFDVKQTLLFRSHWRNKRNLVAEMLKTYIRMAGLGCLQAGY